MTQQEGSYSQGLSKGGCALLSEMSFTGMEEAPAGTAAQWIVHCGGKKVAQ